MTTGVCSLSSPTSIPDRRPRRRAGQPDLRSPPQARSLQRSASFSGTQIAVLCVAILMLASIPILTHPLPPIADYVNHLARMQVMASAGSDPDLARFYEIHWQIVPNLMMDLVVPTLAHVMGIYKAGQVFTLVALNWESVTHGANGLLGIPAISLFGFPLSTRLRFYYFALAAFIIVLTFVWALMRSQYGRAFRSIAENADLELSRVGRLPGVRRRRHGGRGNIRPSGTWRQTPRRQVQFLGVSHPPQSAPSQVTV